MDKLTPDLVARAGIAVYGEKWQMPLAARLGMSDRNMRRIAQAARDGKDRPVPQDWIPVLVEILKPIPLERKVQARYAAEVLEALEGVGEP